MIELLQSLAGLGLAVWLLGSVVGEPEKNGSGIWSAVGSVLFNSFRCIYWLGILFMKLFNFSSDDPFMSWYEAWSSSFLRKSNKGFFVDGVKALSKRESHAHLACIARTGAGKTTIIIKPNILMETEDSLFISDPNTDIFKDTSGILAARGYEIIRLCPSSDLRDTGFYNPMKRAGKNSTELKKLANLLITAGLGNSNQDANFWNQGAENVLTCFLKILAHQPHDEYKNFSNLLYLLKKFIADQNLEGGGPIGDLATQYLPDKMSLQDFNSLLNLEEKIFGGFIASAITSLDGWNDDGLGKFSSLDTVDLSTFRKRKTAVYWTVPIGTDTRYYQGISAIFFSQLYDAVSKSEGLDCKFFLDEVGNFPIPNLSEILTTARNFKIGCCLCLQSESQLVSLMGGAKSNTILTGGIGTRIYFDALDLETTTKLSRIVNGAMEPSEIREMKGQLLISGRRKVVKLEGLHWFNNPRLKKLAAIPPAKIESVALPKRVKLIEFESVEEDLPTA